MIGLELKELNTISPDFKSGLVESLAQQNIELHFSLTDKRCELAVNIFDTQNKVWLLIARGKTSTRNKIKPTFAIYESVELPAESNTSPYIIAIICQMLFYVGLK